MRALRSAFLRRHVVPGGVGIADAADEVVLLWAAWALGPTGLGVKGTACRRRWQDDVAGSKSLGLSI